MTRSESATPVNPKTGRPDSTAWLLDAATLAALVGLPLLGVRAAGKPLADYLEFPPLTRRVFPAPFSLLAFLLLAACILAAVLPFLVRVLRAQGAKEVSGFGVQVSGRRPRRPQPAETPALQNNHDLLHRWFLRSGLPIAPQDDGTTHPPQNPETRTLKPSRSRFSAAAPFPAWGWAGLAFGAAAWGVAWTRLEAFAPLQAFTFSPLWFAYILVVNALTFRRTGRCMLTHRPGYLLGLFAASAGFWWYFEYLNRFVQNWYYTGCDGLTPFQYVLFATLPFATVLPAVLGTEELLATFPRLTAGLSTFHPIRLAHPRQAAGVTLIAAGAGLTLLGVFPSVLFPLLWLSPLLVLASLDILAGRATILSGISTGDWSRVVRFALAALICGLFWEMWNFYSLAKWHYAVPFVDAWRVFEMPLLGYAGYLPFGLECALLADRLAKATGSAP
jgi:hypothetical protein